MKSGILSFAAMLAACLALAYSCQDSNIPADSAGEGQGKSPGEYTPPDIHGFYASVTEDTSDWGL